jgi:hypothetical protein
LGLREGGRRGENGTKGRHRKAVLINTKDDTNTDLSLDN